jgi:hypothetical protein
MTIENLITNKEFMDKFTALANSSYKHYGSYEDVYYGYEDEMSDDDIKTLLDYCEENDLLEY